MKIEKVQVTNFRMLQDLEVNLEDQLSLIIGRNNCGKTSFLTVLERFLGSQSTSNHFTYEDFNCDFQNELFASIQSGGADWDKQPRKGIELILYISYDAEDDLEPIHALLMDLDENNHHVVLRFRYILSAGDMERLVRDFADFHQRTAEPGTTATQADFDAFMKSRHREYFRILRQSVLYDTQTNAASETVYRTLVKGELDLNRIICFRSISARRNTMNKEGDSSLSSLSTRYYDQLSGGVPDPAVQALEDQLLSTDVTLTNSYKTLFGDILGKVQKFGGVRENESMVRIISTLSQQQLLRSNTTVVYDNHEHQLPESYNGLGYLNLISMIMEIDLYLGEFNRRGVPNVKPAAVNLLFIEEPEAHTHPQLQAVFIKNIKDLLFGQDSVPLQAIITTHSSHIVSESDFDDIKYFRRASDSSVISKNLKELSIAYKQKGPDEQSRFKFLKQYLTVNRSEIFFADKIILFEGETEAILLPAMLKKLDDDSENTNLTPLLSQNISRIACGAYSQIFERLLAFLEIKTLIITDLDSADVDGKGCPVDHGGVQTTNGALKSFYEIPLKEYVDTTGKDMLSFFTSMTAEQKVLRHNNGRWIADPNGSLMVVYQTAISDGFHPRSFEDAFFHINRQFVSDHAGQFQGLKNKKKFDERDKADPTQYAHDAFALAKDCVGNKSTLTLDILFHGTADDGKVIWEIPPYIKEGLQWLGKN